MDSNPGLNPKIGFKDSRNLNPKYGLEFSDIGLTVVMSSEFFEKFRFSYSYYKEGLLTIFVEKNIVETNWTNWFGFQMFKFKHNIWIQTRVWIQNLDSNPGLDLNPKFGFKSAFGFEPKIWIQIRVWIWTHNLDSNPGLDLNLKFGFKPGFEFSKFGFKDSRNLNPKYGLEFWDIGLTVVMSSEFFEKFRFSYSYYKEGLLTIFVEKNLVETHWTNWFGFQMFKFRIISDPNLNPFKSKILLGIFRHRFDNFPVVIIFWKFQIFIFIS